MSVRPIKDGSIQDIKEYFRGNYALTFLVGAGCSVDSPSILPTHREMMKSIINFVSPLDESEKILSITKTMQFEQLIELFRDSIDNALRVIDYYGECETPNIQHFFLANMIKKGNYVMTTNFDLLIERALMKLGVKESDIIPVITQKDYEMYRDPGKLIKIGKKPVYKIHGSVKNIITNKSTKDSLITTIRSIGRNKKGQNVFQIEPFKRELFDNVSKNRILIIMGCSGDFNFDIIPTLKTLKDLRSILWFNHIDSDNNTERILEIQSNDGGSGQKISKVDRILSEIKKINHKVDIYRIDTNTTRFIKEVWQEKPPLNTKEFSITPFSWLTRVFSGLSEENKIFLANRIYYDMNDFRNALRLSKKLLKIATEKDDKTWMANALSSIGMIYYGQGNQQKAMEYYEKSLKIAKKLDYRSELRYILSSIGLIYRDQGKYKKAMEIFLKAIKIDEEIGDIDSKGLDLSNISICYMGLREFNKAIESSEEAIKIFEKTGNLLPKGRALNNLTWCYGELEEYDKALSYSKQGLEISKKLGDKSGV
ncbi:MAG: tetratricopeptide repeat protein, partial [Promethearchaeota archaeon]